MLVFFNPPVWRLTCHKLCAVSSELSKPPVWRLTSRIIQQALDIISKPPVWRLTIICI